MICCAGEAIIDMLPRDFAEPAGLQTGYLPVCGGASLNTSIALGRLNQKVSMICPLSQDIFGEKLAAVATEAGVEISWSPRVDRPTTLAFVALQDGVASYFFYDNGSAMSSLTVDQLPDLPDNVQALLTGGIALASEPCGTAFEELAKRASDDHVVAFDPNIRPAFIQDAEQYRARMARMCSYADIIKISEEDLDWLDHHRSLEDFAREQIERETTLVLTTLGANGAKAYTRNHTVHVPGQSTTVVDTVGAGDTFNAGVLTSLNEMGMLDKRKLGKIGDRQLNDVLGFAVNVAAISVTRAGADPPFRHEV